MRTIITSNIKAESIAKALCKILRSLDCKSSLAKSDSIFTQIQSDEEPVILIEYDSKIIQEWLWDTIRCQPGIHNPVIVLGLEPKNSFVKGNSLFIDSEDNVDHIYISHPWTLYDICQALHRAKPLAHQAPKKYRELQRIEIYRHYAYHGRCKILFGHDIPQSLKLKNRCFIDEALILAQKRKDEWLLKKTKQCEKYYQNNQEDLLRAIAAEVSNKLNAKIS